MEELEELSDIFVFIQGVLDRNIEQVIKIEASEKCEYEKAEEIDNLISSESFIRNHVSSFMAGGFQKYAQAIIKRYNYLCEFTRDTETLNSKFTRKRQPILEF